MVTDFLDKERGNHLKWVTNGLGAKQFWSVKNLFFYNTLNGVIIVNVHTCSFFKYYSYTLTILCVCGGGVWVCVSNNLNLVEYLNMI